MGNILEEKDVCPWCKQHIKINFILNKNKKGPKIGIKYGCDNPKCIIKPNFRLFGPSSIIEEKATEIWRNRGA